MPSFRKIGSVGNDRYRSSSPVTDHPLSGARSSAGPVGSSPSSAAGILAARPAPYPRAAAALADGTGNLTPAPATRNSASPPTPGADWGAMIAPVPAATPIRLALSRLALTPAIVVAGAAPAGSAANTSR